MPKRLPLSVVVSAVSRMQEPTGVTTHQVEQFLNSNYAETGVSIVRTALRRAVNEGFLGMNHKRYMPVCYKCGCMKQGKRGRRRKLQTSECEEDRKELVSNTNAEPDTTGSNDNCLTKLVPSFLGGLFK
uniref:H15 domain-containing protein n=1 Tax=Cuerna arida TaxID=1464854 RepID=A0A1B6GTF4_9HEMI